MRALNPVRFMVQGKNKARYLFRTLITSKDSSRLVPANVHRLRQMTGVSEAKARSLLGG